MESREDWAGVRIRVEARYQKWVGVEFSEEAWEGVSGSGISWWVVSLSSTLWVCLWNSGVWIARVFSCGLKKVGRQMAGYVTVPQDGAGFCWLLQQTLSPWKNPWSSATHVLCTFLLPHLTSTVLVQTVKPHPLYKISLDLPSAHNDFTLLYSFKAPSVYSAVNILHFLPCIINFLSNIFF